MVEEQMSKEELIGFHKGALNTLGNERNELAKMLNVVEQLIQAHMKALKDLGVTDLAMPLTPLRVWQAIQAAK